MTTVAAKEPVLVVGVGPSSQQSERRVVAKARAWDNMTKVQVGSKDQAKAIVGPVALVAMEAVARVDVAHWRRPRHAGHHLYLCWLPQRPVC